MKSCCCNSLRHSGNRAVSPTDVGAAVPARAEASTQTELQMVDAGFQVPDCRKCLGPLSEARRDGPLPCRMCAVLEDLCWQVEEIGEEVSRQRSIRENEREIDRVFSETQQLEEPQSPPAMEKQAVSTSTIKVSKTSGEGWKLMTSSTKRKAPAPPKNLQVQNRLTALKIEEETDMPTNKGPGSPNRKPCKATRKKQ